MTQFVLLGDVVRINPTTKLPKGTTTKFVSMDKLDSFKRKIVDFQEREYKGGSKFMNGDTLLARITPCLENGKTAYVDILDDSEIGAGSTEFLVLRAIEGVTDPDYVYYLSVSLEFRAYAIKAMIGTSGRQRVQTDVLARYELSIPDLETQQRIGNQMRTLDEKIELNRKMNETLEQMGQALFRHYFIDNPESEKWEDGRLEELADINRESIGKEYLYDEIQYVDISSVSTGSIDKYETTELISAPSRAKRIVKDGDIIWATVRPNRRVYSLVMNPSDDTVVSTGFAVLSPKKHALGFVYYHTSSQSFSDYLVLHSRGAAYPAVTATDFKNAPIITPDERTLEGFNELVMPNLRLMSELKQEIQTLTTLRDNLLPRLINGKVKV